MLRIYLVLLGCCSLVDAVEVRGFPSEGRGGEGRGENELIYLGTYLA